MCQVGDLKPGGHSRPLLATGAVQLMGWTTSDGRIAASVDGLAQLVKGSQKATVATRLGEMPPSSTYKKACFGRLLVSARNLQQTAENA